MEQLENADKVRKDIKDELDRANQKLQNMEEEVYKSKTIQREQLEEMKRLEDRLEEEMNKNEKIRQECQDKYEKLRLESIGWKNKIYVPGRNSKVDIALGNFLNQYPERQQLKILFIRESEGVY